MRYRIFTFLLFTGLVLTNCSRDTEDFEGPFLVDRFGDFTLVEGLEVSTDSVDFSAGERVTFSARFNKRVDWIVRITGKESGSIKRVVGFDNNLNADNAVWTGGTTVLPLFRAEPCLVELIIPEADSLTLTDSVVIKGSKVFAGGVFYDFEEDPGNNAEFGNFEFEFSPNTGRKNDGLAAQGEWYYLFEGTDNVVPNFFVGVVNFLSVLSGDTYAQLPTTVPEDLWFNMFLYHDGSPHGIAVIQFVFDSNDSGAFEDGQDDLFQLEGDFPLSWTGWRQFSHTMADVGMTQEQLQKLVAIRALLISDMNSQPSPPLPVRFGLDFMIFTEDRPLELE